VGCRPATDIAALALGATTVGFVAPGSLTSGRLALFRWDMTPPHAGGPDPHFHTTFAESFYVRDGTVRLGDGTTWRPHAYGAAQGRQGRRHPACAAHRSGDRSGYR
jgi:hypothetical protein